MLFSGPRCVRLWSVGLGVTHELRTTTIDFNPCAGGEIGRHSRLKICRPYQAYGFDSRPAHQLLDVFLASSKLSDIKNQPMDLHDCVAAILTQIDAGVGECHCRLCKLSLSSHFGHNDA